MFSGDCIRVVHPLFQEEGDGSTPISPLQFHVGEISSALAVRLNEQWHSRLPTVIRGNIDRNTHSVCFGAEYANRFYAVAIWSSPVAGRLLTKGEHWLELRRFAIADDAPRNTASRLLSIMTKMIRRKYPEIVRLISYQDTEAHAGTIYKAAGWKAMHRVCDTNWGLRGGPHSRKRNPVNAPGVKVRWELIVRAAESTSPPHP